MQAAGTTKGLADPEEGSISCQRQHAEPFGLTPDPVQAQVGQVSAVAENPSLGP